MRYVIYGAGAIGGTVASRLHIAGAKVVLIARGGHFKEILANGLEFREASGTHHLSIDAVDHPGRIDWDEQDIVVLTVKSQNTWDALMELVRVAPATKTIVCAQNGVENERLCARLFEHVYGLYVAVPALHLRDGVVESYGSPSPGILDVGRYPAGDAAIAGTIVADLAAAGFSCRAVNDIMRWKRAKLLANLANSIEAAWGTEVCEGDLYRLARDEGERCFASAGLSFVSDTEERKRRDGVFTLTTVMGHRLAGGSTWQSVARGQPTEVDFLNGEIALLGRQYGIPTPVNSALQTVCREMLVNHIAPGSLPITRLEDLCAYGRTTRSHEPS